MRRSRLFPGTIGKVARLLAERRVHRRDRALPGVLASVALAGCLASEKPREEVSGLMPRDVAAKIVATMVTQYDGGPDIMLGTYRKPLSSKFDIHHWPSDNVIYIVRPGVDFVVCDVTRDDARNLATAIRSLGGNAEVIWRNMSGGSNCAMRKKAL